MAERKMTMGVIIGNRGFFPDQLAKSGREEMIQALAKAGMDCVVLGPQDSKHGAVIFAQLENQGGQGSPFTGLGDVSVSRSTDGGVPRTASTGPSRRTKKPSAARRCFRRIRTVWME